MPQELLAVYLELCNKLHTINPKVCLTSTIHSSLRREDVVMIGRRCMQGWEVLCCKGRKITAHMLSPQINTYIVEFEGSRSLNQLTKKTEPSSASLSCGCLCYEWKWYFFLWGAQIWRFGAPQVMCLGAQLTPCRQSQRPWLYVLWWKCSYCLGGGGWGIWRFVAPPVRVVCVYEWKH